MLYWAMIFFFVAVLSAIFAFGIIASAVAGLAKLLFFLFLIGFVVTVVMHLTHRA